MTVRELITSLLDCDMDDEVAVQLNQRDGYFSMHKMFIMPKGHIGYPDGPIIHAMEEIPFEVQDAKK
jgi:hypothetical protein